MNNYCVLKSEGLSKKYARDLKMSLKHGLADIGRELTGRPRSSKVRPSEFWALKDINFELARGESLGILGTNGSGKTTLMKIANGLIKPDAGSISVFGNVGALIALGAGFNPVLTGRENIFINAAVYGANNKQTKKLFDEIVNFAELHDAIDAPIRSYSSGMIVRLGFSIAVHVLKPNLLLLDEVLAVGDEQFRVKCFQKVSELKAAGTAIVLVSHNIANIYNFTDKCLHIEKGVQLEFGNTMDVGKNYEKFLQKENNAVVETFGQDQNTGIRILNIKGPNGGHEVQTGEKCIIEFEFLTKNVGKAYLVDAYIRGDGLGPHTLRLNVLGNDMMLKNGEERHRIVLDPLSLPAGTYAIKFYIHDEDKVIHGISRVHNLSVTAKSTLLNSPFYQKARISNE